MMTRVDLIVAENLPQESPARDQRRLGAPPSGTWLRTCPKKSKSPQVLNIYPVRSLLGDDLIVK
jgi:hypothetical protein